MEVKEILNHGLTLAQADRLLDKIIEFPEIDARFERVRPITDFRKDDFEARVLYICRRLPATSSSSSPSSILPPSASAHDPTSPQGQASPQASHEDLYILKCKIQAPSVLAGGLRDPVPGPSSYTTAELQALGTFGERGAVGLPHLVAWKKSVQGGGGVVDGDGDGDGAVIDEDKMGEGGKEDSSSSSASSSSSWPMSGGYAVYVVMTLMPGVDLMALGFWGMKEEEREEIREKFLVVIKSVWRMGFEPYDCALRNILWEKETKKLSLVDFEHWHATTTDPINMNHQDEMMRWGLVKRKASATHWEEWFFSEGLTRKRQ